MGGGVGRARVRTSRTGCLMVFWAPRSPPAFDPSLAPAVFERRPSLMSFGFCAVGCADAEALRLSASSAGAERATGGCEGLV